MAGISVSLEGDNIQLAFQKGDQVAHPAFGQGVVLESEAIADDEQVTVLFRAHPTPKKLSMAFARLERV